MRFTVILTPDEEDGGYVAECPAIPGCVSEGDTIDEALANAKEAIEACLESLSARHEPLPSDGAVIVATVEADMPEAVAA
jgi:predicted RNase H-like HicB family nuclease